MVDRPAGPCMVGCMGGDGKSMVITCLEPNSGNYIVQSGGGSCRSDGTGKETVVQGAL